MRTLSAHQRFAKSRSRWILPAFPEHTFSVLRGLGQLLNKQKTLKSAEAEISVFPIWRAICIACGYYTKFGITAMLLNIDGTWKNELFLSTLHRSILPASENRLVAIPALILPQTASK